MSNDCNLKVYDHGRKMLGKGIGTITMPPPRRKHPIRKPPPPKPASSLRTPPAASTSTPSASAVREANEAARMQNMVMAEQIMKSDAPEAVKRFVTRPSYKEDLRAWNEVYEAYLAHLWGPDSTTKRIDLDKVEEYDSWVSGPAILNRENKRRNVRDYAGKLAQIVLHSELKHDSLLEKWRKLSTEEREAEFFVSMKTMTDNGNEASQTRNEVPEITLERMTANGGQGFVDLVNHFVDNYKKNLTDPSWDIYQPLKNEVYDRIYMLDRSDDDAPLPKGIRAFQEEMLLDRHLYMILFSIGILLKLNGVKMKFTQPSKGDEDEGELDSLDVENKLSLKEKEDSRSPRQDMSNVRQYPLTSELLRQLSDFTSDIFYHVYYTSPSTGEERKQPLKFSSNRDAIKSFLPIRNAAIQARDDKACGLLCAILIEGCVDDYAGGEVTEEMVVNQMKKDFEWTDEQANTLVPPEYILVQLDVVPDLPEAVQQAEASGAKVEKEKGEGCETENCAHVH
ncbi:uncharacterized protein JCM6883_006640 [Sporobolomyces salmoneus]|uniref:uncharacterized protein n=1 Tax=Sporobolomyces salmoneus TaxID=183962 RepID=UPI003176AF5D